MVRHRVGPLDSIPEDQGLRVEVGGKSLGVYRRGQQLFALGDTCPHMGASLSEGYVDGKAVVCPWHGWVFDLEKGTSPFDDEARVPVYRVFVEDGDVFVEVHDATAVPGHCPASPSAEEGNPNEA